MEEDCYLNRFRSLQAALYGHESRLRIIEIVMINNVLKQVFDEELIILLSVYKFDYSDNKSDWIVAANQDQAHSIFKEFVKELPTSVTKMTKQEYINSFPVMDIQKLNQLSYSFNYAPCHLDTTESV